MTEVMTKITAELGTVQDNIVVIGGLIVVLAVTVMGIRWIKAQFF